jgi:alpha-1,3-mannosyltransferase
MVASMVDAVQYSELCKSVPAARVRTIFDVPIRVETAAKAVTILDDLFRQGSPTIIAFANAHALNVAASNISFRNALRSSVVLNDGIGTDIASRILYGSPFPENLNGTDFTPRYLGQTTHRFTIFLLGSKPGVAERAAARLCWLCPQHRVVGFHSGYFEPEQSGRITDAIRNSGANLVLVGMGNPRQELWLRDNLAASGCRIGFAVGALFDFLTDEVPRASEWVRAARLEWLHRLVCEPRRLWSRYLLGNMVFLLRVAAQWGSRLGVSG